MKIYIYASLLSIVGSCATKSYKERIQDIKDNIVFEDSLQVKQFGNSITEHVAHTQPATIVVRGGVWI